MSKKHSLTDSPPKVLITGAAGYIGKICQYYLDKMGYMTVGLDNLTAGTFPIPNLEFYELSLNNLGAIQNLVSELQFDAVVHLAAKINVNESTLDPDGYYHNNVLGSQVLLQALESHCSRIVFASSAAVYGEHPQPVLSEDNPIQPTSPYGEGKYLVEEMIRQTPNLSSVSLRLFNVAGAYLLNDDRSLGEEQIPETHLIPSVIQKMLQGQNIQIFGYNHDTIDGTCIRDYIHVLDVVQAIEKSIQLLLDSGPSQHEIFNVGSANGHSVLETIQLLQQMLPNCQSQILWASARDGDPSSLIANNQRLKNRLNWKPQFQFADILHHSVQHQLNLHKYWVTDSK